MEEYTTEIAHLGKEMNKEYDTMIDMNE